MEHIATKFDLSLVSQAVTLDYQIQSMERKIFHIFKWSKNSKEEYFIIQDIYDTFKFKCL